MEVASAPSSGGFFLSLLTESYAVRALLGSLVAAGLAALAVRFRLVATRRARRLVVLAPVLTAAVAAAATIADAGAYLPQLWVTGSTRGPGQVLELLGELRVVTTSRGLDLLVVGWALVSLLLVSRRALGLLRVRRWLSRAVPAAPGSPLTRLMADLSRRMDVRQPVLLLLPACPGGAFTSGIRRPVVVVDPLLIRGLDDLELEGLLAHELAHAARRDPLLGLLVGVFSDLSFFLPPVALTRRWLHREQEESADELASARTHRPAALASSILKVWQHVRPSSPPVAAPAMVAAVAQLSPGARVVTARVERLVVPRPVVSPLRGRLEVGLAAAVLVAAVSVSVVVPSWIANDLGAAGLSFAYVPPPVAPVESPAFATFRALAPAIAPADTVWNDERRLTIDRRPSGLLHTGAPCPCVETQAQLAAGAAPVAFPSTGAMSWSSTAGSSWGGAAHDGSMRARPLWTSRDVRPRMGVFVLGQDHPR